MVGGIITLTNGKNQYMKNREIYELIRRLNNLGVSSNSISEVLNSNFKEELESFSKEICEEDYIDKYIYFCRDSEHVFMYVEGIETCSDGKNFQFSGPVLKFHYTGYSICDEGFVTFRRDDFPEVLGINKVKEDISKLLESRYDRLNDFLNLGKE